MKENIRHIIKKLLIYIVSMGIAMSVVVIGTNLWMLHITREKIVTIGQIEEADCIMVLGAYVRSNRYPSDMLRDRLNTAYEVYAQGGVCKFLLSGDHGQKDYDEVNVMREYMEGKGVAKANLFLDHAGFSTYESIYRAEEIFEVNKMVIVTQAYHLPRALYMAKKIGIDAVGVPADHYSYPGMPRYKLRECLARTKDFVQVNFLKTKPTYLGEAIPVSGDGRLSQDE